MEEEGEVVEVGEDLIADVEEGIRKEGTLFKLSKMLLLLYTTLLICVS